MSSVSNNVSCHLKRPITNGMKKAARYPLDKGENNRLSIDNAVLSFLWFQHQKKKYWGENKNGKHNLILYYTFYHKEAIRGPLFVSDHMDVKTLKCHVHARVSSLLDRNSFLTFFLCNYNFPEKGQRAPVEVQHCLPASIWQKEAAVPQARDPFFRIKCYIRTINHQL